MEALLVLGGVLRAARSFFGSLRFDGRHALLDGVESDLDGLLFHGRLARGLGEELHLVELLGRRARAWEGLDACCTPCV